MNYSDPMVAPIGGTPLAPESAPSGSSSAAQQSSASASSPSSAAAASSAARDCVYTFSDNCSDSDDDADDLKFKIKNILQAQQSTETVDSNAAAASSSAASTVHASPPTSMSHLHQLPASAAVDPMDAFPGFTPPTQLMAGSTGMANSIGAMLGVGDDRTPPPDANDANELLMMLASPPHLHSAAQSPGSALLQLQQQQQASAQAHSHLILSPPEQQGDVSPMATAALIASVSTAAPPPPTAATTQPVRRPANGALPKTGKPLSFASSASASAAASAGAATRTRAPRARPNRKALVTMYQSQISDNQLGGIKLRLKKSSDMEAAISQAANAVASTITGRGSAAAPKAAAAPRSRAKNPAANARKRAARKAVRSTSDDDHGNDDDDEADADGGGGGAAAEKRARKAPASSSASTSSASKASKSKAAAAALAAAASAAAAAEAAATQSVWGARLPEPVLAQIFAEAVRQEGALPTLVRLGKVCHLWQRVSVQSGLWRTADLARWTKEKHRTELRLRWLLENRCAAVRELNVSNWKVTNVHTLLELMADSCPNIESLTFSGWKSFTSDDLLYMAESFPLLRRVDLSAINIEASLKSAVSLQALCLAIQLIKGRLTHLYLSHNRLAGIPQIVTALATFCPNLELLDLSNVSTVANSHGVLHLEKLQTGCTKLKVLRVTNSQITLGAATLEEQMSSPGFPELEELSIAALSDESRFINDDYLQRYLKTSAKLQLLDVRGCARLTHESMIRLPAWDLKHLFLSGCAVTRDLGSGLELLASKWAHSLVELDLAWANVQAPIDAALRVLAEKGEEAAISHLNLCGSSVSQEAVKEVLLRCPHLASINLASCRGLPRGVKRLMQGTAELNDLREALGVPVPVKTSASSGATATATASMTTDNSDNNNSSSSNAAAALAENA